MMDDFSKSKSVGNNVHKTRIQECTSLSVLNLTNKLSFSASNCVRSMIYSPLLSVREHYFPTILQHLTGYGRCLVIVLRNQRHNCQHLCLPTSPGFGWCHWSSVVDREWLTNWQVVKSYLLEREKNSVRIFFALRLFSYQSNTFDIGVSTHIFCMWG